MRRRDIADIFLGTGLGARAYAIIEQGMISRMIEAKPEELRVFLEEAAGVSKYRERRRETELRLKDTRENLLRVDDIRQELDKQLEHLQAQAEVAKRYHELQGELKTTQGLLWLTRRQEAASARARHAREIERLGIELEAETAKLREAEKRLEHLRDEHYRAGDAMHAAQGALYETNAEVARLEQQIAHVRENRSASSTRSPSLRAQLEHGEAQLAGGAGESRRVARAERAGAGAPCRQRSRRGRRNRQAAGRRGSVSREPEPPRRAQRALAQTEQALQVEAPSSSTRGACSTSSRSAKSGCAKSKRLCRPQMKRRWSGCAKRRTSSGSRWKRSGPGSPTGRRSFRGLEQHLRDRTRCTRRGQPAAHRPRGADPGARPVAGAHCARSGTEGLALAPAVSMPRRGCGRASRSKRGWEDALEAVLRERLNGIALEDIDRAAGWLDDSPPGKMTVVDASGTGSAPPPAELPGAEPLRRYVTCRDPRLESVLADWLHQVYVVPDAAAGLALRASSPAGAMLVTREGHVYTRHSVSFHAPDSELHGVLSRQREIEELEATAAAERAGVSPAQPLSRQPKAQSPSTEARSRLCAKRSRQTQQRHHALQMEGLKLSEQAQQLTQRGEQIALELSEIAEHIEAEAAQREDSSASRERLDAGKRRGARGARARDRALRQGGHGAHAAARSPAPGPARPPGRAVPGAQRRNPKSQEAEARSTG